MSDLVVHNDRYECVEDQARTLSCSYFRDLLKHFCRHPIQGKSDASIGKFDINYCFVIYR